MEPNLIEWLKPYRPENGRGKICINFGCKFRAFQKAAGEKWNPWPKDCLRHSCGSYHLAKCNAWHYLDTSLWCANLACKIF
jgi:hypothetical protein